MREVGNRHGRITAYPRQLESLIRLAEAHARMRLSHNVELIDVEEASRLHQEALKQSATDPTSGTINLDIITTGQSESYRRRREEVKKAFKALLQKKGKVQTLNYMRTWMDLKESSDLVRKKKWFFSSYEIVVLIYRPLCVDDNSRDVRGRPEGHVGRGDPHPHWEGYHQGQQTVEVKWLGFFFMYKDFLYKYFSFVDASLM